MKAADRRGLTGRYEDGGIKPHSGNGTVNGETELDHNDAGERSEAVFNMPVVPAALAIQSADLQAGLVNERGVFIHSRCFGLARAVWIIGQGRFGSFYDYMTSYRRTCRSSSQKPET
jgi:hypothetical protein